MIELTSVDRQRLIIAIASKEWTASELALQFGHTIEDLRTFTSNNIEAIELAHEELLDKAEDNALSNVDPQDSAEVTPTQLDDLWITKKFERLWRYQRIADALFDMACSGDSVATREVRSYMRAAADELGQLLHRGAGESGENDYLSVDIQGVDMGALQ